MRDHLFNIKALLEVICRVSAISANRLAEDYLHKDPAIIVRWKSGHSIPGIEDLSVVARAASKKAMESQKVQIRNEVEDLICGSALEPELQAAILCREDFEGFLLEALSASAIRRPKDPSCKYDEQSTGEIIEAMECISLRLSCLQEHIFYSDGSVKIDSRQVESFTSAICRLPVKAGLADSLQRHQKESKLSLRHMQSFFEDIKDICGQYSSLAEFLEAAAQAASSSRPDIMSCYVDFIRLSGEAIGICTNIACVKGLLAINGAFKPNKALSPHLKSMPFPNAGEILASPAMALSLLSDCIAKYDRSVSEKESLLKRLTAVADL